MGDHPVTGLEDFLTHPRVSPLIGFEKRDAANSK
jgi:hypothetical protein